MPASDGLQPILTDAEREICKSYGGWTNFSYSMGLKPFNEDDNAEARRIISALASQDNSASNAGSGSQNGTGSGSQGGKK